jgi:nitroimidazol reductase NimA-like FMN-containing flavoprotein (pyridoxamine 5'-phosphate oxidase superfamily)
MKLTKDETEFIKSQNVGRVATVSKEGIPHNVPVCPVLDAGKVYFGTENNAKKVNNIKANPHAAIVFDVYSNSWKKLRGVLLQCEGRVVDPSEFKRIRRKLYAKYPQYETDAALEPEDSVIIELAPAKKFSWGFE